MLVSGAGCKNLRSDCYAVTQLLATSDGGNTWSDITPWGASTAEPLTQKDCQYTPGSNSSQLRLSISENNLGFDMAMTQTITTMGNWWSSPANPFCDIGIYIGGENLPRAYPVPPYLTSDWVSQIQHQGWGLWLQWSGLQAPAGCTPKNYYRMPSTPADALNAGIKEAQSASVSAYALGLPDTIIHWDIENYNSFAKTKVGKYKCGDVVGALVSGWVSEMRIQGFLAGVYANPDNAANDLTVNSLGSEYSPDDAWIDIYYLSISYVPSVLNLAPLKAPRPPNAPDWLIPSGLICNGCISIGAI